MEVVSRSHFGVRQDFIYQTEVVCKPQSMVYEAGVVTAVADIMEAVLQCEPSPRVLDRE